MIRIDLRDRAMVNPDGSALVPDGAEKTLKDFLSRMLVLPHKEDPVKTFEMARRVATEGILEVDSTDCEMVEKIVKENGQYIPLVKAQVLLAIRDAKLAGAKRDAGT